MRRLLQRLNVLFHGERFRRDMEEEMAAHREMLAADEFEAGAPPDEAARRAAVRFGNTTALRERSREAWGWGPVERFWQDIRYAARTLRKNPGFTMVVVLVLALGIGANTASFSAIHAVILNPLAFPDPDSIVLVDARHVSGQNSGTGIVEFLDWRAENAVFDELAIFPWTGGYTLGGQGAPERVIGAATTHGFARVLGFAPALGRFFTAEEDSPGGPRVTLIGYAAWQRRYAGSADVLGKSVTLDGIPHTIIGVMPDRFALPGVRTSDFWLPIRGNPGGDRLQHQYLVIGRMKPGIVLPRAQADMTAIAERHARLYPATNTGWSVRVSPARSIYLDVAGRPMAVLFSALLFVLLLACANVAGMLLARGSARAQEMIVRAALGAGRWRIMRQVLTESAILALLGGALGLAIAQLLFDVARAAAPPDFVLDVLLRMNWRTIAFAIALSLATGLAFGVAPAWFSSKTDLATTIKSSGSRSGAKGRSRALSCLVAAEVGLSLVLLVVAMLLTKDLGVIIRSNIGIRVDRVLAFALDLPRAKYPDVGKASRFYGDMLGRIRAASGIESAGAVDTLPFTGSYSGGPFEIEGRPKPADWMELSAQYIACTPGYFSTVAVPLLAGRDFNDRDTESAPAVAVLNETLARRFFPDENPIGHRINVGGWRTIVGVVGPVKQFNRSKSASPQIYLPAPQFNARSLWVVVRTSADPALAATMARDTVREFDPELPIIRLSTMRSIQERSLSDERFMATWLSAFSGTAVLIAAIGIYGVIAWSVSRRTFEIGVRVALGASYGDVIRMVMGKGLLIAATGALAGLALAAVAATAVEALLYGVKPHDPVVFGSVTALILIVAAGASFLPARRAARLDPTAALRVE